MNVSEQPASKQWGTLKFRGVPFAEVWFKPEGNPFALKIRIPQESFRIPGIHPLLTTENLLKAVGIPAQEVASWHQEGAADARASTSAAELAQPLQPPDQHIAHLYLHIQLKPPVADNDIDPSEVPEEKWQTLEARWKSILALEGNLETLRISMETLRTQMETSLSKPLTTEEKQHALRADIAQWDKAKSRIQFALPKAREFIHRATWAMGAPERKKLQEVFENHILPRIPFPAMDQFVGQLENFLKDRQVLVALGTGVHQECTAIAAEVQRAHRTLQQNAAANAVKKSMGTRRKGRFI